MWYRHCKSITHERLCEQVDRRSIPRAVLQLFAPPTGLASCFATARLLTSPRLTSPPGRSSGGPPCITPGASPLPLMSLLGAGESVASGSSSSSLVTQSSKAVVSAHSGPCSGLVSGAEYYQLAICFSEKATAKIGQAVEQDALLPYVCHADREQRIAVIHLRNCFCIL